MANCSNCIYNPNDCSDWCHVCLMSGGIFYEAKGSRPVMPAERKEEAR